MSETLSPIVTFKSPPPSHISPPPPLPHSLNYTSRYTTAQRTQFQEGQINLKRCVECHKVKSNYDQAWTIIIPGLHKWFTEFIRHKATLFADDSVVCVTFYLTNFIKANKMPLARTKSKLLPDNWKETADLILPWIGLSFITFLWILLIIDQQLD